MQMIGERTKEMGLVILMETLYLAAGILQESHLLHPHLHLWGQQAVKITSTLTLCHWPILTLLLVMVMLTNKKGEKKIVKVLVVE